MAVSVGDIFLGLNLDTSPFNKQLAGFERSSGKIFSGVGKVIAGALSTAAIGAFAKSCLDLGSDLQEVQNVVDVTFPSMNEHINSFAKNAINQFGLSETVAKRMAGTYGAMSKAFGFSEAQAYDMSTALTGLAGDVASFYNLDPTEAYTKLKSVFSGETETLKDLGIVMTQNALDQYALANGFGKTTSAMSEQEKVMLRLNFVTEQLSAASGDFARTSDSWANKTRVLNLNFQSLKATIGQGLINVLSPVVSLLNNLIARLQKAAEYFVAFTSLISGNKKTNDSLGSVSSSASSVAENITGIGDAAKKTSKQLGALAGFDEINNINKASEGASASGGGSFNSDAFGLNNTTAGTIDTSSMEEGIDKAKELLEKFTSFYKKKGAIITSISAGIGTALGVFFVLKNIGVLSSGLTTFLTVLATAQTGIYTFFAQLSMGNGIMAAFSAVFGTSLGPIIAIAAGIGAVTAALVYLYQTSDSFRTLVNSAVENVMTILKNLWSSVLQPLFGFLIDVFKTVLIPIAVFIANVFVKAVGVIATVVLSFWNNILSPIASFLVNVLGIALQGVLDIWNEWKPAIEDLFKMLSWLWDNCLSPLVDFVVGTFTKGFEKWGQFIGLLIPNITGMFKGLIDFFVGVFTGDLDKAWNGIKSIFDGFTSFLGTVFNTDWTDKLGALGIPLNLLLSNVKSIWETIKGIFQGIIKFVTGVFTGDWKKAWQGIKNIFSSIVKGLASIFKNPINAIIDGINSFIGGINRIKIPDWVPGVGGFGFNIKKIPKLAEGGYVKANTPQLAMIGDNRTQGEIVSPEDKMFEIMTAALKAYGSNNANREDIQVLVSILYEILEAIRNLKLTVDGDSLNDDQNRRNQERALRTGKLIY